MHPDFRSARAVFMIGLLATPLALWAAVSVAPPADVVLSADPDQPAVGRTELWQVRCDEPAGAHIVFSAPAFEHETIAGTRPAIGLTLLLEQGTAWNLDAASATSTPGGDAVVSASSAGPGDADFTIELRFIPVPPLPAGTFTTTLTATISANP